MWHGYFLLKLEGNLKTGLNDTQRSALKTMFPIGLAGIVETSKIQSVYPHERLQIRTSLDSKELIAEATWRSEPQRDDVVNVIVGTLGSTGASMLGVALKDLRATVTDGVFVQVFERNQDVIDYIDENVKNWDG